MMTVETFYPELVLAAAAGAIGFLAWFYVTREHAKLERRDRERAARR